MKRWSVVGERQLARTGNTTVFRSYGACCGSGLAREKYSALPGTGYARVRGQARSHRGIGLDFKF